MKYTKSEIFTEINNLIADNPSISIHHHRIHATPGEKLLSDQKKIPFLNVIASYLKVYGGDHKDFDYDFTIAYILKDQQIDDLYLIAVGSLFLIKAEGVTLGELHNWINIYWNTARA
jgi:hypothetical protein